MNTSTIDFETLFHHHAHPGLQALAKQGQVRHYRKNTLLIDAGDTGQAIYLILSGRLREFAMSSDSRPREITLAVLGPGQLVGAMALDGGPHCASVLALSPVACAVIPRDAALAVLRHNPALAMDLLQLAWQRVRLATETTRLALFSDAYSRLSALLQRQHQSEAQGTVHPMTHAQMAQHIGCSREMVSRIMKELVTGGYVVRETDKVYRLCKQLPLRW
jgi:CRP/FNR family cyclic AMP-dependent transcriptional regulator